MKDAFVNEWNWSNYKSNNKHISSTMNVAASGIYLYQ